MGVAEGGTNECLQPSAYWGRPTNYHGPENVQENNRPGERLWALGYGRDTLDSRQRVRKETGTNVRTKRLINRDKK